MKRLILSLLVAAVALGVGAAEKKALKYVDASTFTTVNKAQNDGLPFRRLDISKYPGLTARMKTLSLIHI